MEEDLTALILGDAALNALVGDRVHWLMQPGDAAAFPYMNMQGVDPGIDYHLNGESGLRQSRIQVDIWGTSYGQAKLVARAFTGLLSGYRGQAGQTYFQGVFVVAGSESPDQLPDGAQRLFRIRLDIDVGWALAGG